MKTIALAAFNLLAVSNINNHRCANLRNDDMVKR